MRLNRPDRKRRAQSAHTLAEVMVAALILGTMAVSLFAGFSTGFAVVLMAREDERATQILNGKIELVRLCKWDDLIGYPTNTFQEYYDPLGANNSADGTLHNGTNWGTLYCGTSWLTIPTNVIPAALPYVNNMRLLTVQVQWTNYIGKNVILRQRQMQTLVARDGIQNYPWGSQP